jgi:glycosyltransferase 2 family protein
MSERGAAATRLERVLGPLQVAVSLGLLALVVWRVDFRPLEAARAQPGWLGLTLLCTVPAYALAAVRWSFTAERLGVGLGFGRALREVYTANLLNCVLPSGVAGDALRVVRHGRTLRQHDLALADTLPRALGAVLLERFSGQLVLFVLVAYSMLRWHAAGALSFAVFACALLLPPLLALLLWQSLAKRAPQLRVGWAVRQGLIARGAVWVQLATSSAVLLCCLLGFFCAARGLGLALGGRDALFIVPPMLLASALPLSIGGFGLREASSAALYGASGLDPAAGAAVAALYGVSNLLGALPGAAWLWRPHQERA